jgi:hypothetical protein
VGQAHLAGMRSAPTDQAPRGNGVVERARRPPHHDAVRREQLGHVPLLGMGETAETGLHVDDPRRRRHAPRSSAQPGSRVAPATDITLGPRQPPRTRVQFDTGSSVMLHSQLAMGVATDLRPLRPRIDAIRR